MAPTSSCVRGVGREDAVVAPEPQHDDAVGDGAHVLHVVADHDDAEAAVAQPLDQVQHLGGLRDAEGRGRLVEHDDLRGRAAASGRWRRSGAGRRRARRSARARSGCARRARRAASRRGPPSPPRRAATGRARGRGRGSPPRRGSRRARGPGRRWRCRASSASLGPAIVTGWPLEADRRPRSAACTPASTLTSVDLPAPLSPTSATTSPAWTSRSMSVSAETAPKFLQMPRRLRIGSPAGGVDARCRSCLRGLPRLREDRPARHRPGADGRAYSMPSSLQPSA